MAAGQAVKLTWNGDQVRRNTLEAARKGLNATLADCEAQSILPGFVRRKTGNLAASTRMNAAKVSGTRIQGSFGRYMDYSIWEEIGTRFMSGTHGLRRSADIHVKQLPNRIKEFMP